MLYRIIAVDYQFPASSPHGPVSEMVKDLIRWGWFAVCFSGLQVPRWDAFAVLTAQALCFP